MRRLNRWRTGESNPLVLPLRSRGTEKGVRGTEKGVRNRFRSLHTLKNGARPLFQPDPFSSR